MILSVEQIDWGPITWSTEVLSAWGSVLGSVGTAGAVIAAVWFYFGERRQKRREASEQELSGVREVYVEVNAVFKEGAEGPRVQFLLSNQSAQTISAVALVEVTAVHGELEAIGFRSESRTWIDPVIIHQRIPAGETAKFDEVSFVWTARDRPWHDKGDLRVRPTVEFVDVAGRRWRRRGDEQPVRVLLPGFFAQAVFLVKLLLQTQKWRKGRTSKVS